MRAKTLLLAMVLAWAACAQADPLTDFGVIRPKIRMLAPNFTLAGMDGQSRTLSSYRGKVVMLHFWATWCVPCRNEMPVLHHLDQAMAGKDFEMICVNVDRGNRDKVEAFMHEIGMHFHSLLDPEGDVRNAYAVRALPTSYLIGRDGKFLGYMMGERDWKKAGPMLAALLDESADDSSGETGRTVDRAAPE